MYIGNLNDRDWFFFKEPCNNTGKGATPFREVENVDGAVLLLIANSWFTHRKTPYEVQGIALDGRVEEVKITLQAFLQFLLMLESKLEPKDRQRCLNTGHQLQSRCREILQPTTCLLQIQFVIFSYSFFSPCYQKGFSLPLNWCFEMKPPNSFSTYISRVRTGCLDG